MKLYTAKKIFTFFFLLVTAFADVNGQSLKKSAQTIRSQKNISYTDIVQTRFSFQEDFSIDTLHYSLLPVAADTIAGGKYQVKGNDNFYAFDGSKLIRLNLTDSTYSVGNKSVDGQYTRTLLYWAQNMDELARLPLKKITQCKDTIINDIPYFHIRVTESDTIENGQHFYNITHFIIDKKNDLPISISREFMGHANDGTLFGLIEIHSYSNYKLNQKNFPDLSVATIPDHFKLPVKRIPVKFLSNGTPAPSINAVDLSGNAFALEKLKGKIVLINFSLLGCPHCIGAAQMLNSLHKKYKDKGLVIINIYPVDQKEAILKFDKKENVETPSYISDRTIQKTYPYDGYPSFYLLNKSGLVAQSYNGFYKALESELSKEIEAIY